MSVPSNGEDCTLNCSPHQCVPWASISSSFSHQGCVDFSSSLILHMWLTSWFRSSFPSNNRNTLTQAETTSAMGVDLRGLIALQWLQIFFLCCSRRGMKIELKRFVTFSRDMFRAAAATSQQHSQHHATWQEYTTQRQFRSVWESGC